MKYSFILMAIVALLCVNGAPSAQANEADLYCANGTTSTGAIIWAPASAANPCSVSSGGGGGGGAATIANGADVAEGNTADAAYVSGSGTVVAILKGVFAKLGTLVTNLGAPFQAGGSIGNTSFVATPQSGTVTVDSGTVTTGGTFQAAVASSGSRKSFLIENPTTATEPLSVCFGTIGSCTVTNSITLAPGGSITPPNGVVPTDAINVTATTTAHAFIALVW